MKPFTTTKKCATMKLHTSWSLTIGVLTWFYSLCLWFHEIIITDDFVNCNIIGATLVFLVCFLNFFYILIFFLKFNI